MVREIGRILVSALLLALCGFLYWVGIKAPEVATTLEMTNVASAIVGGLLTYWLKP